MPGAITYKDIYLSLPGFLSIQGLEIKEQPGKHSKLQVKAMMDPEWNEFDFYELPETISLNYMADEEEKILFKGVIVNSQLEREGGNHCLLLEAQDGTHWMDLDRKNRCFQNIGMTASSVISEIMKGYGKSDSICNVPDEPIGELIFQYEETDWEFLNRFLSKYNDSLYPAATFETAHFQAGISIQDETVNWDSLPNQKRKNFSYLEHLKQNGFPDLLSTHFISYCLDSYDVIALGSRIRFQGNLWYVASVRRYLRNGLLTNTYELKQKEAMITARYYNPRLVGISQYAVVTNTQRDRLQASMVNELMAENCYWFPFSSISSSPDGSGWYCMPEQGESVRIYFPTEKEKDAYVITCIKGHKPGGADDPMGNPAVRSISTADGNLVQFNDEGILIAAKTGSASVSLKKDGEVIVSGAGGIELSPTTSCRLAAKDVSCKANGMIKMIDDSGAAITAGSAGVFLNAQEIYEN